MDEDEISGQPGGDDPMIPADDFDAQIGADAALEGSEGQALGDADADRASDTCAVVSSDAPPSLEEFGSDAAGGPAAAQVALTALNEVPVRVQAVLGRARVSVGELVRMKSGMVLELDRRVGEPVDVFVNNRLVARGEVMLVDHSLGVTLTEIVHEEG